MGGWLVVVGLQVFSVSPSPIETNWVLEFFGTWSGLGLGAFGTEEGLPKAIESEPHASRRQAIQDEVQASIKSVTEPLEKEIESNGMALVSVQQGPATQTMIMPVVDGEPVPHEALRAKVSKNEASEEQLKQFEDVRTSMFDARGF